MSSDGSSTTKEKTLPRIAEHAGAEDSNLTDEEMSITSSNMDGGVSHVGISESQSSASESGRRKNNKMGSSSSSSVSSGSSSSISSDTSTSSSSMTSSLSKDESSLVAQSISNPRGIFWESLLSVERERRILLDPTVLDETIDDIIRILNCTYSPLEDVACQVTYLEYCKQVRLKMTLVRDSAEVLSTCDYRSMDEKDQRMLLKDIENVREKCAVQLKQFIERLVLRRSTLGKTRVRASSENLLDVAASFERFLVHLDKAHKDIQDMIDGTVETAMACRLGFNEIEVKRRLKKHPTATKQMYEGLFHGEKVAITAFKTWDWTEARRIISLTTRSDTLLGFYGYAVHDDIYYLAFEYAALGHVAKFISSDGNPGMHYITVMDMLKQILEGLTFLHESGFRMGTLTVKTVLVCNYFQSEDEKMPAQIRIKLHLRTVAEKEDRAVVEDHDELGICRWRRKSPEAMEKNEEYANSDVYAAGTVLWETFSAGEVPWCNKSGDSDICDAICSGEVLPRPESCPEMLYNALLLPMWRISPALRPSAMELNCRMDQLLHLSEVYGKDMGALNQP